MQFRSADKRKVPRSYGPADESARPLNGPRDDESGLSTACPIWRYFLGECLKTAYLAATTWFTANVPTKALRLSCSVQETPKSLPWYSSVMATAGMACAVCVKGG